MAPPARLLTLARDLQRRKARERADLFVAEGVRAVEELLASPLALQGALLAPQLTETPRGVALRDALAARGIDIAAVSERDLASASDTDTPQGVLVIAAVPSRGWADLSARWSAPRRVLVLDAIQDPGNVGTMLRTARALGVDATIAMPGTVDLWNGKVVRSAMGALFSQLAFSTTWDAFDIARRKPDEGGGGGGGGGGAIGDDMIVWGADVTGQSIDRQVVPERLALVVGNEGHGLSEAARARVSGLISVPIVGVESLNAGVAAGILLYALRAAGPTGPAA